MDKLKIFCISPAISLLFVLPLTAQDALKNKATATLGKAKETAVDLGSSLKKAGSDVKKNISNISDLKSLKTEGKKAVESLKGLKGGLDSAKQVYEEIKGQLKSKDAQQRLQALKDLDFRNGKEAISLLKDFVKTSKGDEKGHALSLLMKKGEKGQVPVMAGLREKVSPETRMRMAYNARYIQDPALLSELMKWFENDKDELVREYALQSLSQQKGKLNLDNLKKIQASGNLSQHVGLALDKLIASQEIIHAPKPPAVDANAPLKLPSQPTPLLPQINTPVVPTPDVPKPNVKKPIVPTPAAK